MSEQDSPFLDGEFRPRHRGDLQEQFEDPPATGIVFRSQDDKLIAILNRSAYEIWLLCDGWRTVDDIVRCLAAKYELPDSEMRGGIEDVIAESQSLGLLDGPREKTGAVTISLQTAKEKRGFFAILVYVWSALYFIRSDHAKKVVLLDGENDYWGVLFEPSTDLVETGAAVAEVEPYKADYFIQQYPELAREDADFNVLPHHLTTWPDGKTFAKFYGDRRTRRRMHRVFKSFVRPRASILNSVDTFCDAGMKDCPTIGLHLRSTRHLGVVMEPEEYVDKVAGEAVQKLVAERKLEDYRVFVATHVGDYLQYCRRYFGERLLERDIKRDPDPGTDFLLLDATRADAARDVLIDCLILSRCDYVFGGPSNVLLSAPIFNPENELRIFDYALDLTESLEFFASIR